MVIRTRDFPLAFPFPLEVVWWPLPLPRESCPWTCPRSVLVKFTGEMQPGITLRDLGPGHSLHGHSNGTLDDGKEGKEECLFRTHSGN